MHCMTKFSGALKQDEKTGSTDVDRTNPSKINQQHVIDDVPLDGHRVSAPLLPRCQR